MKLLESQQLRILSVADQPPDPNSGAAGTVYSTNVALRELGHQVDEIWSDDLSPRRIRHGNLHSLLEQPRLYRREVAKAVQRCDYDVIMISQPQGYLAAKYLKKSGFDGVVVNRSHGLELRVNEAVSYWHRKLGIPASRSTVLSQLLKPMLDRQWTQAMRWFDGIIVPCTMDKEFLETRFLAKTSPPVQTIHHGVSDTLQHPPPPLLTAERMNRVLHVGQFAFFKGSFFVAQIVNRILAADPQLTFTWVTSTEGCRRGKALIEETLWPRVSFVPWTNQSELCSIFDNHGIFLFPTLCEGAAKSCLEAMMRGLCVVGSDDSGIRDYVTHGVNGYVCPVGNVEAFSSTLMKARLDKKSLAVGIAARDFAAQKSWFACARQIEAFFRSLLNSKIPGSARTSRADGA